MVQMMKQGLWKYGLQKGYAQDWGLQLLGWPWDMGLVDMFH
jgi:hypothetical protein